jgi:hypothetical protein
MKFDRNSNYVLAGSDPVKKNSVFIFILIVFYLKIRRRSLDNVIKNSVFVITRLRNHGKYSPCWIDFVCNDIAYSLME